MAILLNIDCLSRILEADYPVIIKSWVFPLVVGLLSLSMPLLINNILRVDEKYKKYEVGRIVLRNCSVRWYKWSIVITVIAVILFLARIPRDVEWGPFWNKLVDHSAEIFLIASTISFLLSVLFLTRFILRRLRNTHTLYEYYSKYLRSYFTSVSTLEDVNDDSRIARNNKLSLLFAIIENAFEEQNQDVINDIISDFKELIEDYRESWGESLEERHIHVEYPRTFREELIKMHKTIMQNREENSSEALKNFIKTIFFDEPSKYGDVPKYGLSFSTMQTLFQILINAVDNNQKDFVKQYWRVIFNYTHDMFYSQAVTNEYIPHSVVRYELNDEDNHEQETIAYMHFMLQAYLYEKKDLDTLKYILEYYNRFQSVLCLNFLSIDTAIQAYKATGSSDENLNYSKDQYADLDRRNAILANYVVFLANYCYNKAGDVPVCSNAAGQISYSQSKELDASFKGMSSLPNMCLNRVEIKNVMSQDEYNEFLNSLRIRQGLEEVDFIQKTPIKNFNKGQLFKFIKSHLSFEIPRRRFVWNPLMGGVEINGINHHSIDVVSSWIVSRELLIYDNHQKDLAEIAFSAVQNYLRGIDQTVSSLVFAPQSNQNKRTTQSDELRQVTQNTANHERIIFFYIKEEAPALLAERINYLYENGRDFISPKERDSYKCIKCIKLKESDQTTKVLENQIWVLPNNQQPVVSFVDINNQEGWEMIQQYMDTPANYSEDWFKAMPQYIKIADSPGRPEEEPSLQLLLKCKIEIIEVDKIHAQVYTIEDLEENHDWIS